MSQTAICELFILGLIGFVRVLGGGYLSVRRALRIDVDGGQVIVTALDDLDARDVEDPLALSVPHRLHRRREPGPFGATAAGCPETCRFVERTRKERIRVLHHYFIQGLETSNL